MPFRWNHLKPSCRWNHRLNPFGIVWKLGTVHPLTNHHFLLLRFAKINGCICHMFNFSCGSRWAVKKQFRVFPSYYPIVFPSTIIYCYIVRHTPYIHYKSVINPFRVFPGYSPTRDNQGMSHVQWLVGGDPTVATKEAGATSRICTRVVLCSVDLAARQRKR